ncbi:hypothetical protein MMC30_002255 [Trapelia coarctata]|nr:hypothetical protein [Trapelia coarctata]
MEVLSSRMQEPTVPLSPALTDPDMILPYQSRSRSSTPPLRNPLTPSAMSPFFANQAWEPMGQTNSIDLSATNREPLGVYTGNIIKPSRPSLPGAWQTEEDLQAASDTWTNQTPPLESPSMSVPRAASKSESASHRSARHHAQETENTTMLHQAERPVQSRYDDLMSNGDSQDLNQVDERSLGAVEEDENDPFSYAAEILANAKRRLTDMEDNLSRARRSLSVTPSTSKSSISSRRRVSPPDTIKQGSDSWTINTPKTRHSNSFVHTRVFSETSVPSPASTVLSHGTQGQENPRSSSAMESAGHRLSYIDEDDLDTPGPLGNGMWGTVNRSLSLGGRHRGALEPLREDESVLSLESPQAEQLSRETSYIDLKDPPKQLTRARSSLQMRDLHERMQELRGQLTSLKIRTDRDSMHRKSLQTLKTPSPFTVAKDWANTESYIKHPPHNTEEEAEDAPVTTSKLSRKTPSPPSGSMVRNSEHETETVNVTDNGFTKSETDDTVINPSPQPYIDDPEPTAAVTNGNPSRLSTTSDDFHDPSGDGFANGDEVDAFEVSDDGEASDPTISIREESHEDRPDAFDYEHFFLHSGMGTFSRINPDRPDSRSSYDSAETTKAVGPVIEEPAGSPERYHNSNVPKEQNGHPRRHGSHSRQNSADSISTVNTFATAIERSETPGEMDEIDWSFQPSVAQKTMKSARSDGRSSKNKNHEMQNETYLSVSYQAPQPRGRHPSPRPNGSSVFSGGQPSILPTLLASAVSKNGDRAVEVELSEDDTMLVQNVLQSLQAACGNLSRTSSEMDKYEKAVWRQRLKAAQQILEGDTDMDGCTF